MLTHEQIDALEEASASSISGASDNQPTFTVGDDTIVLDLGNPAGAQPTYTIDSMRSIDLGGIDWNNMSTGPILSTGTDTLTWSDSYSNYTFAPPPTVEINTDGVNIKDDGDLKIGDRSMKDFMDKVEDQLAILRPAPELEEKWDKLKELRRQYEECKQDILEKEKIMKILKED